MIKITATLVSGDKVMLVLAGNFAVVERKGQCTILDGVHNNGGWQVQESYETICKMIEDYKP